MAEPVTRGEMLGLLDELRRRVELHGFKWPDTCDMNKQFQALRSLLLDEEEPDRPPDKEYEKVIVLLQKDLAMVRGFLAEAKQGLGEPDRWDTRNILAVPRSYVEFCIRKSDSEEHKEQLRGLLEPDRRDGRRE